MYWFSALLHSDANFANFHWKFALKTVSDSLILVHKFTDGFKLDAASFFSKYKSNAAISIDSIDFIDFHWISCFRGNVKPYGYFCRQSEQSHYSSLFANMFLLRFFTPRKCRLCKCEFRRKQQWEFYPSLKWYIFFCQQIMQHDRSLNIFFFAHTKTIIQHFKTKRVGWPLDQMLIFLIIFCFDTRAQYFCSFCSNGSEHIFIFMVNSEAGSSSNSNNVYLIIYFVYRWYFVFVFCSWSHWHYLDERIWFCCHTLNGTKHSCKRV